MIKTAKICICDRCGTIARVTLDILGDELPKGWVMSEFNNNVHFCPKCNPNIPSITPSDSPLYWPPGVRAVPTDYREYEITCEEN